MLRTARVQIGLFVLTEKFVLYKNYVVNNSWHKVNDSFMLQLTRLPSVTIPDENLKTWCKLFPELL